MKVRIEMKAIDINVILTFCSYKENQSQEFYDLSLGYSNASKSVKTFLKQSGFFGTIVKICEECGRSPTDLVKISTVADWTKKGFTFDIENGKWSFGSWRGENTAWSDRLAKQYGFGTNDSSANDELNFRSLRGFFSAKVTDEEIYKAMGK